MILEYIWPIIVIHFIFENFSIHSFMANNMKRLNNFKNIIVNVKLFILTGHPYVTCDLQLAQNERFSFLELISIFFSFSVVG